MSEILGAIMMIGLTLAGFALIAPSLIGRTQQQAADVAQQYQNGAVQLGQLLTVIYHCPEEPHCPQGNLSKVGLYDYGNQKITPLYVFVSTTGSPCGTACLCPGWDLRESGGLVTEITPGVPVVLEIPYCLDNNSSQVYLNSIGAYQLFIYSTYNLGYTFAL